MFGRMEIDLQLPAGSALYLVVTIMRAASHRSGLPRGLPLAAVSVHPIITNAIFEI